MPLIKINKNDSFEFALRKFKKACDKAGILAELKKREFYIKTNDKKKQHYRYYNKHLKKK